jgi:hypothetical protein
MVDWLDMKTVNQDEWDEFRGSHYIPPVSPPVHATPPKASRPKARTRPVVSPRTRPVVVSPALDPPSTPCPSTVDLLSVPPLLDKTCNVKEAGTVPDGNNDKALSREVPVDPVLELMVAPTSLAHPKTLIPLMTLSVLFPLSLRMVFKSFPWAVVLYPGKLSTKYQRVSSSLVAPCCGPGSWVDCHGDTRVVKDDPAIVDGDLLVKALDGDGLDSCLDKVLAMTVCHEDGEGCKCRLATGGEYASLTQLIRDKPRCYVICYQG